MVRASRNERSDSPAHAGPAALPPVGDAGPLNLFRAAGDAHIGQTLTRLAALASQQHLAQLDRDTDADQHAATRRDPQSRDERQHGGQSR